MPSEVLPEQSTGTQPLVARSPQQMRGVNATAVLGLFWDEPAGTGLTASELVTKTGLTRATVLAVCDDLRQMGWLIEDRAQNTAAGKGRQPRRFTFNARKHFVVGSDVGLNSVTSVVADLKGKVLGRARHRVPRATDRTDHLIQCTDEALRMAEVSSQQVATSCVGVAASVDRSGEPLPGNPFWDLFRIDLGKVHDYAPFALQIENDADLAAVAELHAVTGDAPSPSITLLVSDRFGAGIMVGRELLRGAKGSAGEMAYLDHVVGVGGPYGLSLIARWLRDEALAAGRASQLRSSGRGRRDSGSSDGGPEDGVLESVVDAAANGDALSAEIVEKLTERLAVTIATLCHLIDPARVVLAGGVAVVVAALLPQVRVRLAELLPYSPQIEVSTLGRDVVLTGAVHSAISSIRHNSP
ncbi:ROK family protein [Microlunatus sp. GCM10028923]|uniref:ROK family protein n=1 Tax=Microlunatus sp. GCM10028923 TaxID=3273400 RepID=UPI0036073074